MKSVFIVFNQVLSDTVQETLDYYDIRGFTLWAEAKGRGTTSGEPHMGSHTWPAMNSAILAVVDEEKVPKILEAVRLINAKSELQGIRAFVWHVEQTA
ncbi:MAG TPA: P-II family nitrogen regulator [Bacteroidales bacterium]|nr:P-II family nitrogen regulator [Bacteroidales bacterium]